MPRFLVVNDDGIESEGLRVLVRTLSPRGEVYVCAPDGERSATAQSVTLFGDITAREISFKNAEKAWAVSGTPADCAKFGIQMLEDAGKRPDILFAGINKGSNAGTDIHYSGTVGAAVEGGMSGIRSIALSVDSWDPTDFQYICDMIPELMEISSELGSGTVLNVNAPDLPIWKVKGTKILPMGPRTFDDRLEEKLRDPQEEIHEEKAPDGAESSAGGRLTGGLPGTPGTGEKKGTVYRYKGIHQDHSGSGQNNDLAALQDGYAVITPMSVDLTDRDALIRIMRRDGGKVLCFIIDPVDTVLYDMWRGEKLKENLIALSRALGRLGVYTVLSTPFYRRGDVIDPGITRSLDGYETVDRIGFSLLDTPDLKEKMAASSEKRVILAGGETHVEVAAAAMDLLDRGIKVTILRDCCSSRSKQDHEAAIELLRDRGCEITTSQAWAAETGRITGRMGCDAFDQIFR